MLEHSGPHFSQLVRTIYSIVPSYSNPDTPSLKIANNSMKTIDIDMNVRRLHTQSKMRKTSNLVSKHQHPHLAVLASTS